MYSTSYILRYLYLSISPVCLWVDTVGSSENRSFLYCSFLSLHNVNVKYINTNIYKTFKFLQYNQKAIGSTNPNHWYQQYNKQPTRRIFISIEYLEMRGQSPRIFILLRIPKIDSKESILPAYVAWQAGTTTYIPTQFLAPLDCLKSQAQRLWRSKCLSKMAEWLPGTAGLWGKFQRYLYLEHRGWPPGLNM